MQITNDFELSLPADEAYALLLDLDRVVPCMPGAELGEAREDGSRDVKVTVKVGPIKLSYGGTVSIAERDDAARSAVLRGQAKELRGQGNAAADIRMTVSGGDGSRSTVATVADVQLTGRAAQTARGIVDDVARRMIADMVACLEARHARAGDAPSAGEARVEAPPAAATPIKGGSLVASLLWARVRRLLRR